MSTKTKPWFMALTDIITGVVMKIGIIAILVSILYLMFVFFGDTVKNYWSLSPVDQSYFVNSIEVVTRIFTISTIVVVLALMLSYFYEEALSQWLSFTGAVFYFGVPLLLIMLTGEAQVNQYPLLTKIVNQMRDVGLIILIPGAVLLVRDMCLHISNIMTGKRVKSNFMSGLQTGEQPSKEVGKDDSFKLFQKCWNTYHCKPHLRKVCPAYRAKKSCWRIKSGCFCDENVMMKGIIGTDSQSDYSKRAMERLGSKNPLDLDLTKAQKVERCRKCDVFKEHQRNKYKIMVPLVFPIVGGILYYSYNTLTNAIYSILMNTNKFVSFVTNGSHEPSALNSEWRVISILFVIWLGIMLLSYSLKFVEYLVFKLQV